MLGSTLLNFVLLFIFSGDVYNSFIVFGITEMAVLLLGLSIPMVLLSINRWIDTQSYKNMYTIPGLLFGIPLTIIGIAVIVFAVFVLQEVRDASLWATAPVLAALAAPLYYRYQFISKAFANWEDMDMRPFLKDTDDDILDR